MKEPLYLEKKPRTSLLPKYTVLRDARTRKGQSEEHNLHIMVDREIQFDKCEDPRPERNIKMIMSTLNSVLKKIGSHWSSLR